MYLLTINLYELGQFLRIVLWICLPVAILSMMITTWFHYRRKRMDEGQLLLSVEGFDPGGGQDRLHEMPATGSSGGARMTATGEPGELPVTEAPLPEDEWMDGNNNIYRGIMWMKEKYEQYRELTDKRYEQLRDQLNRSEQRYQAVLLELEENRHHPLEPAANLNSNPIPNPGQDRLAGGMSAGEASRQVIIDELEEQLRVERLKVEELVVKLQNNSQLLLNIYQELDKSINDMPAAATSGPATTSGPAAAPIPPMPAPTPAATQP